MQAQNRKERLGIKRPPAKIFSIPNSLLFYFFISHFIHFVCVLGVGPNANHNTNAYQVHADRVTVRATFLSFFFIYSSPKHNLQWL